MAEYLIKGESLVAIADEVRELSGKTEAMGTNAMVDTLRTENSNFNTNLNAQDDLLAQIEAALKGKAAGGGGASGGSVETCTVTFSCPGLCNLVFNYVENGEVKCRALYLPYNIYPEDFYNEGGSSILKGSFLICGKSNLDTNSPIKITTSGEVEVVQQNIPYTAGAIFKINGDCTITIK